MYMHVCTVFSFILAYCTKLRLSTFSNKRSIIIIIVLGGQPQIGEGHIAPGQSTASHGDAETREWKKHIPER